MRMSSVVENTENGKFYVFSKGSPEKISDLCANESLP